MLLADTEYCQCNLFSCPVNFAFVINIGHCIMFVMNNLAFIHKSLFPVFSFKQGFKLFCASESESSKRNKAKIEGETKSDQHYLFVDSSSSSSEEEEIEEEIVLPWLQAERYLYFSDTTSTEGDEISYGLDPVLPLPVKVGLYFKFDKSSDDESEIEEEIYFTGKKVDHKSSEEQEEIMEEIFRPAVKANSRFKDWKSRNVRKRCYSQVRAQLQCDVWSTACFPKGCFTLHHLALWVVIVGVALDGHLEMTGRRSFPMNLTAWLV